MRRNLIVRILATFFVSLLLGLEFRAAGQASGIYADFTTSMGSFTCKLEYAIAPKAVANFIGLANGQRTWLDLPSGHAKTNAFYNGLIFHRVVPGFIIQAGSPNQLGTDGPGYVFPDEISPSIRFTNTGVLAMANSGTNSNGSQFFITATSTSSFLNDGYTAFGQVIGGTNVVIAIDQVATSASEKPLTNVIIQNIGIRRVGTAAQAFDINAQGLPIVSNLPLRMTNIASQVSLSFSNRLYSDNRLYSSTNLSFWNTESLGIEINAPVTNNFYRVKDAPNKFFSIAQIQYPASTLAPKNLLNHKLALTLTTGGSGTLTATLDGLGGGTFTFPPSSGNIDFYSWTQDAYRGFLFIAPSGFPPLNLKCPFAGASTGTFTGTAYPNYPTTLGAFSVGGTFSLN